MNEAFVGRAAWVICGALVFVGCGGDADDDDQGSGGTAGTAALGGTSGGGGASGSGGTNSGGSAGAVDVDAVARDCATSCLNTAACAAMSGGAAGAAGSAGTAGAPTVDDECQAGCDFVASTLGMDPCAPEVAAFIACTASVEVDDTTCVDGVLDSPDCLPELELAMQCQDM